MQLASWFALALTLCLVTPGCGTARRGYAASPSFASPAPAAASAGAPAAAAGASAGARSPLVPEQLVVEGTLAVVVEEPGDLLPALRALVDGAQGRIVAEVVRGAETSWSAELALRVPPSRVDEVVGFLARRGEVLHKRITVTDVSKQLFDQELALANLRTTLDRLTAVMGAPGLTVAHILEIEREMTRVRGQIDQLEGDRRFLQDRVALASLAVTLSRRAGAVTVARAKAYPGARLAALTLLDPGERPRSRLGVGLVVHAALRALTFEVDLFRKAPDGAGGERAFAALATLGGATYSDFLGKGQRRALNPYLGARLGYGHLDGGRFVVQGEAGLELLKARYVVIDASVRATALIGAQRDLALVAGVGAAVAF